MLSWSFLAHTLTVPSMEELRRRLVLFGLGGSRCAEEKRTENEGEGRKVKGWGGGWVGGGKRGRSIRLK